LPKPLQQVLDEIAKKNSPPVILVGGSSEFLSERAFHEIRDAILAAHPGISVEAYEPGSELAAVIDSYRTMSLFGGPRLMVLPEVNAFVSAKELTSLFDKSVAEWKSAKTDRKRATASAKLLHVLGLVGCDLDMKDNVIATALGVTLDDTLTAMLTFSRATGKKAGRGEDDAALLTEAIARGGASGTILLMRAGEMPRESATVELIDRTGAVVIADVSRESFNQVLADAVSAVAAEADVKFEPAALNRLRQKLGIERMLADKFAKDVPDLRLAVSEAERLVTLAGAGERVSAPMVDREVESVEGGARYELGSLFTEGKYVEAVSKLRDLVAQARRDDPKASIEIQYGRFLFPLADEIRQMIAIHSYARSRKLDLRSSIQYNRFKDTVADSLGDYLKGLGLVRQRPHPFPLHKKWEAARVQREADLFRALAEIADIEVKRKSGGLPVDLSMETFLLSRVRG
jgi:DNA polymerase III delta subunit